MLPDVAPAEAGAAGECRNGAYADRGPGLRRGDEFSASAVRLAGLAGALLGWRPVEFWAATPAELATVLSALNAGGDSAPAGSHKLLSLKVMFPDG